VRRIRWTAFVVAWAVLLLVDVFYVPDLMNSHHGPTRGLGYLFGHTLELLLGDIQRFEVAAFMLIAAGAGLLALIRGWQWYRARQRFR